MKNILLTFITLTFVACGNDPGLHNHAPDNNDLKLNISHVQGSLIKVTIENKAYNIIRLPEATNELFNKYGGWYGYRINITDVNDPERYFIFFPKRYERLTQNNIIELGSLDSYSFTLDCGEMLYDAVVDDASNAKQFEREYFKNAVGKFEVVFTLEIRDTSIPSRFQSDLWNGSASQKIILDKTK
jgi:hypothetical protein